MWFSRVAERGVGYSTGDTVAVVKGYWENPQKINVAAVRDWLYCVEESAQERGNDAKYAKYDQNTKSGPMPPKRGYVLSTMAL